MLDSKPRVIFLRVHTKPQDYRKKPAVWLVAEGKAVSISKTFH